MFDVVLTVKCEFRTQIKSWSTALVIKIFVSEDSLGVWWHPANPEALRAGRAFRRCLGLRNYSGIFRAVGFEGKCSERDFLKSPCKIERHSERPTPDNHGTGATI